MKVLQINCVYNSGSTGKIVYDIHSNLLNDNCESIVCYGNGPKVYETNVYKTNSNFLCKINAISSRLTGVMYGGCFFSTKKLISIIKKEKPDIVHVHCINGHMVNIYKLIEFLKNSGIKTVLTLHAEFMHTANCGYALDCDKWKNGCGKCPRLKKETSSFIFDGTHKSWVKMKKAFDGFENLTVVAVSSWLMERAKQSPILADKNHTVVLNGLDTGVFKHYDASELRDKHNLTDEKIIFHASPNFNNDINSIKGGYYILKLAEMLKDENVKIIVAGSYDASIKAPENVILLGRVSNQEELAKYYSMADLTVLTSKKETFSMVVAESLSCGTPVVGFLAGGPEQIAIKDYSDFVAQGDIEALYNAVQKTLSKNYNKEEIARKAENIYSKKSMVDGYKKIYKIIGKQYE
ncbi:MAG: glycosyltransferase [Clostridia bacterium]|nr:glycosyltransferase [Clostridia bacterium]